MGASKSCIFSGLFGRIWPKNEEIQLGHGVTITTDVHYNVGRTLTLPPGLYHVGIAALSDCEWTFGLISTAENTAGIGPVVMLSHGGGPGHPSVTESLRDTVQFYAQFRSDHNAAASLSGTIQIIHDGRLALSAPLQTGLDASKASASYFNAHFNPDDPKNLGKYTVKFIVKIGSEEFTSTGEFMVTTTSGSG